MGCLSLYHGVSCWMRDSKDDYGSKDARTLGHPEHSTHSLTSNDSRRNDGRIARQWYHKSTSFEAQRRPAIQLRSSATSLITLTEVPKAVRRPTRDSDLVEAPSHIDSSSSSPSGLHYNPLLVPWYDFNPLNAPPSPGRTRKRTGRDWVSTNDGALVELPPFCEGNRVHASAMRDTFAEHRRALYHGHGYGH